MIVVGVLAALLALAGAAAAGFALGARRRGVQAQRPSSSRPAPTRDGISAQVVQALAHGVVVVDRDEQVLLINPAARAMGVLVGGRLAFADLIDLVRISTDTGEPTSRDADLPIGRLGREPIALSATAVPLPGDDGRTAAVALMLDDVTEGRRLDAVRRDFVANVSHELKTPVGALTLLAEAVQEAAGDPEAVERFAGRMQHEGARLGRLVRELIDLSRLQGAERLPGSQIVQVATVLEEAVDRTRLAADKAGIAVVYRCSPELTVRGNEGQLTTAVANLIDNAIGYSPRATRVAVNGRLGVDPENGLPCAEILVSDRGIGINEGDLARVFERFYRVDPARSRATGGTGLGLAIVKHVATNHGGSVAVWSVEGAGSTFTIRLPVVHPGTGSSEGQPAIDYLKEPVA